MSDETKTKLEGDDAITFGIVNAWRRGLGYVEMLPQEWAEGRWPDSKQAATVVLAWVRAHLVAPAVAEARKNEREKARVAVDGMRKERDSLRAKVAELEAHTCKGSGEEWREVLFPNVEWALLAPWAQRICNLAAEQMAVPRFVLESCRKHSWSRMSTRLRDRLRETFAKLREEHGEMLIQTASEEYHRGIEAQAEAARGMASGPSHAKLTRAKERALTIAQEAQRAADVGRDLYEALLRMEGAETTASAALPKVGETVEVRRRLSNSLEWDEATVLTSYAAEFSFRTKDGLEGSRTLSDEGWTWRRVQPQPSESAPEAAPVEPAPEDVATPALDKVQTYTACITGGEDEAMEADRDGIFVVKSEAKAAYRRDLAAGIARATERLRKENADLRRQLAQHAGECWCDEADLAAAKVRRETCPEHGTDARRAKP